MLDDIPEHEQPVSERFRLARKKWADLDAEAKQLEKCKETAFDELVLQLMQCAFDNSERIRESDIKREVRTSKAWKEYLSRMIEARRIANHAKAEADALDMRKTEIAQKNAAARDEKRFYRMGG